MINPASAPQFSSDLDQVLRIEELYLLQRVAQKINCSRVFLYSDGLTEAVNSSLEEYGAGRILEHAANQPATVQSLLSDVDKFTSGSPKADDVTVVMIAAGA